MAVYFVGLNASAATIASLGASHISIDAGVMYLVHQCSMPFFEWGSLNSDQFSTFIADCEKIKAGDIVVSGLAKGIETATHKGCLDCGGRTIAVVGTGLNHVYPKENKELQQRIIDVGGMILSEQDPKTKASPRTLIARTRLQVALADKVYVVECEKESGTMHAVKFAHKYGKSIYALDCDWSGNCYLIDTGFAYPFKRF